MIIIVTGKWMKGATWLDHAHTGLCARTQLIARVPLFARTAARPFTISPVVNASSTCRVTAPLTWLAAQAATGPGHIGPLFAARHSRSFVFALVLIISLLFLVSLTKVDRHLFKGYC